MPRDRAGTCTEEARQHPVSLAHRHPDRKRGTLPVPAATRVRMPACRLGVGGGLGVAPLLGSAAGVRIRRVRVAGAALLLRRVARVALLWRVAALLRRVAALGWDARVLRLLWGVARGRVVAQLGRRVVALGVRARRGGSCRRRGVDSARTARQHVHARR